MSELFEEFQQTLSEYQERYRDNPRRELRELLLIALEREQLVTIAYRNDLMESRVTELALPVEIKRIFLQCLAWAWKDEQMHAIYTRGLLLRFGTPWIRLQAFVQQTAGTIAGWSSSVSQHVSWRRAPLSKMASVALTFFGRLAGKVPEGVKGKLRLLSLQEFCTLQVDAERTAAACWKRLFELTDGMPEIDGETRASFKRMWEDEETHCRVFAIIADSLGDADALTVTPQALAGQLREVDEFFVPREFRSGELSRHPIGGGGPVVVLRGGPELGEDEAMARLLDTAKLDQALVDRAAALGKRLDEMRVIIKPTFMLGYHQRDMAMVTSPNLLNVLARRLRDLGCADVAVAEGRNIYDQYADNRSVHAVAGYFGYGSDDYRLVDLTDEQVPHGYPRGMGQQTIARSWRDADFRILFPKLRSHPVDFTHLCLGAVQGIAARLEEFLFVERMADRDTALLMPLTEFPPNFSIVDGYLTAADGLMGIISGLRAPRPYRLYAGGDALAVDLVATRHMGLSRPRDSALLDAACHWFGDPSETTEVVGVDEPIDGWRSPYHNELTSLLSLIANPMYRFASYRGAAFLPPMDQDAFPWKPKARGPALMTAQRWLFRKILRMDLP